MERVKIDNESELLVCEDYSEALDNDWKDYSEAWDNGFMASQNGLKLESNPYKKGDLGLYGRNESNKFTAWLDGYSHEEEIKK